MSQIFQIAANEKLDGKMSKFSIRRRTFGIILLLLLSIPVSVSALDPNKSIAQYGHSLWLRLNGLPANAVNFVLQTQDGYLWLGTSAGLFRFDGVSFNLVNVEPDGSRSYKSISALFESSDNCLWIGTGYSGLRCFHNGLISRYGLEEGFFDTEVRQVIETRDGQLLIGTSIGVYKFSQGKFSPVLLNPNYISAFAMDSKGKIWVGTHDGVRVIDESKPGEIIKISTADGLQRSTTTAIFVDAQDNIWIGTVDGLSCYKDGQITNYSALEGLSDSHINTIFEDKDGNLWVGTQNGLNRLANGNWTSFTKSDGLTDNDVLSIAQDHEGNIWVGTSDGLNQFKDVNIATYTTYDGLANNYISSVLETPDGSIFFLSDQGSNVTQFRGKRIRRYNLWVGPAYVAKDSSLWIGQSGRLVNIKNNRMTLFTAQDGIPQKWISAISEDDESLIMYIDHKGIFRYKKGKFSPYRLAGGGPYTASEYVVCFYQQTDGPLWIGMADSLVKIDNGICHGYTKQDGLAGNWVSSIYDNQQGTLWISSPQGGLTRYRDNVFSAISDEDGLFTSEIYCVLGDDQGGIWLSSPVGIGYIREQELNDFADGRIDSIVTTVYTTDDGMKTDECFGNWQPSGWKSKNGYLWFATKKGAVKIDPKSFKKNEISPQVKVDRISTGRENISSDNFISLRPNTDKIEFHYTALSFVSPGKVLFKYKLEGYDKDWVDAGTRRAAYYTNLSPGRYRFHVIACNNDGVWNTEGAGFEFELRPNFYQTYWFFGLILIVLAGSIFGTYRLRVWQLLQREKELNQRIQEATANIKTLSGLIPICANCKKIRDDEGYWEQLEGYIQTRSDAQFSHGICPDCMEELYPEYVKKSRSAQKNG